MTSAKGAQASPPSSPKTSIQPQAGLEIRDARPEDMEQIQRIYAHHVQHSIATFEEIPPSVQEMQERLAKTMALGLPYLAAILDGKVAGYCYATLYRPRAAYRYTLEDSIYLAPAQSGKGLGKVLLAELIRRCEQGPWRQMVAVIAGHDNRGSIALHRNLGFAYVGSQPATGYKFNQWIDVVFMQRALGPGADTPPEPWQGPPA
ncbi:GNAT family N-acetyltransferase [Allopusillimonas ginsengisoli]|uniref:GNAT family N-acetyltransferase n=1 Tax=Allopusillimonas ginsengisoli TaxID=453575 RepID=UPI0010200857|nr:GNAT family N-acetyltransferase [Allopusillimonas ginsengisoli]TEA77508.1 N-acetyltransferase family protein [Allopusillimonas ginsengisoli]